MRGNENARGFRVSYLPLSSSSSPCCQPVQSSHSFSAFILIIAKTVKHTIRKRCLLDYTHSSVSCSDDLFSWPVFSGQLFLCQTTNRMFFPPPHCVFEFFSGTERIYCTGLGENRFSLKRREGVETHWATFQLWWDEIERVNHTSIQLICCCLLVCLSLSFIRGWQHLRFDLRRSLALGLRAGREWTIGCRERAWQPHKIWIYFNGLLLLLFSFALQICFALVNGATEEMGDNDQSRLMKALHGGGQDWN